jgi:hypothetical protein
VVLTLATGTPSQHSRRSTAQIFDAFFCFCDMLGKKEKKNKSLKTDSTRRLI